MRLTDEETNNFETLRRACVNGDLALILCESVAGERVPVICAMQREEDGCITAVPLAKMFTVSPYDEIKDPTT